MRNRYVIQLFNRRLLMGLVDFLLFPILRVSVPRRGLVTRVIKVLFCRAFCFVGNTLIILLLRVSTRLLRARLFVLTRPFLRLIRCASGFIVLFLTIMGLRRIM